MDDMNAFERQVAGRLQHHAGPVGPVDDLAIFESVTAASRSRRWGFTMFSALKFMVAGVIVALFGGLLAAGMFTVQRSDEVPPAAVSAPPTTEATSEATKAPTTSVRTDILPGVALTVEEVEPGVYRVVNDRVRDLILGGNTDIVAGHDGGIWLLRKNQFVPLGGEGHGWATERPAYVSDFEVAPDGTVWVQADGAIQSFDGEGWTTHHEVLGGATVEVTPDGRVWAVWQDPEQESGQQVFGYLDEDGWQASVISVWSSSCSSPAPMTSGPSSWYSWAPIISFGSSMAHGSGWTTSTGPRSRASGRRVRSGACSRSRISTWTSAAPTCSASTAVGGAGGHWRTPGSSRV